MKRVIKVILLTALFYMSPIVGYGVPRSNFGTEIGAELVKRANAFYKNGKYDKAKVLYEEALSTGDAYYARICRERLRAINVLNGSKKKVPKTTVFTISQDTVKINYLGGDYPIHVTGKNWSATSNSHDDWCKLDVDTKKGIIKIYSSPNENTESRETVITVKNGSGQKKTIEVINEGSPEILRSSAQSLVFTPSGETNVVDIDANTDWSLGDVPDWLKAIKGSNDIQFTATPNDENKDRIASVKVETPSRQQITINIIQGAALDSLAFSKNNLVFGKDGGDEYIHVFTDADDWRFGDFPHWCQLERVNENTIRVHCTPNEPVDMPREASINVTNGSQTLGINVFQEPAPIVHLIPVDGIGGRSISFGIAAGYVFPFISAKSSSPYTFSAVNYALGNQDEQVSYASSGGLSVAAFADMRIYKNFYINAGVNFFYYKYRNGLSGVMPVLYQVAATHYSRGTALYSYEEKYTQMTMDIPILASYRIPLTKISHLQFNLGPVLSIGLSSALDFSGKSNSSDLRNYKITNGQMTNDRYDNSISTSQSNYDGKFDLYSKSVSLRYMTSQGFNGTHTVEQDFDSAPFNRFNFGLRAGVGYEYMGIGINISYQFMLTNSADKKFWDGKRWTVFSHSTDLMTGYSQRNNLLIVTIGYTFRY